MSDVDPNTSAVKAELDRLEYEERVPALQPRATRLATVEQHGFRDYRLNARGGYILILPDHPAVKNYVGEREHFDHGCPHDYVGRPLIDRAVAERNYETACNELDARTFGRFTGSAVSLSSIIETRAAARYWFKIIGELRHFARIERQNRRARLGLKPLTAQTRKLVRRYLRQSAPTRSTAALWGRNK